MLRAMVRSWITALFVLAFIGAAFDGWRSAGLFSYLRLEPQVIRRSFNPNFSTDGYIRELLANEGVAVEALSSPTDVIRVALDTLPPGKAVIFVVPRHLPKYNVMYLTIRYLNLQRPSYYLPCDQPLMAHIPTDEQIGAVLSYLIDPPPDVTGHWRLMPRLTLTPTSETEAWKPYCSR